MQSDDPASYKHSTDDSASSLRKSEKSRQTGNGDSSGWKNEQEQEKAHVDPPRALPISGLNNMQKQANKSSSESEYKDRVYDIDAFCNLECGAEGECFMSRSKGNIIKKRCLCPHGKFGEKCAMGKTNKRKKINLNFLLLCYYFL